MNLHCDLDLENNNLIFTPNIPAHDNVPSKFGCKKISSSADMVETDIFDQMSPHCDPELEDRKLIFLHILAHDVTSPHQLWLQKVQQQRIYHQDEHSLEFFTSSVTLTLTTTDQSIFSQENTPYDDVPSNQVS